MPSAPWRIQLVGFFFSQLEIGHERGEAMLKDVWTESHPHLPIHLIANVWEEAELMPTEVVHYI